MSRQIYAKFSTDLEVSVLPVILPWKNSEFFFFISAEDNLSAALEESSECLESQTGANSWFLAILINDCSQSQLHLVRNWHNTSKSYWQFYLRCHTQNPYLLSVSSQAQNLILSMALLSGAGQKVSGLFRHLITIILELDYIKMI